MFEADPSGEKVIHPAEGLGDLLGSGFQRGKGPYEQGESQVFLSWLHGVSLLIGGSLLIHSGAGKSSSASLWVYAAHVAMFHASIVYVG